MIVEDNVSAFPALLTHGAPWVRIMSCNPLEMKDADLPPTFSGYPVDDRTGWEDFARSTTGHIASCGRASTSGCGGKEHRPCRTSSSSTSRTT